MAENGGWIEAIMHNKMAAFLTEAFEEERTKPWRTFLSHRLKYFRGFFSILLQPTNHRPVSCRQLREKSEPIWTVDCCVSSASGIFRTKVELLSEWDVKVLANLGLGKISNIHFSKSWKLNGEISMKNWDDDSVLSVTLTHHASQQLTGRLWLLCCITTCPNSAMNYDLINYRIWMLNLTKIELYRRFFRYFWMFDCLHLGTWASFHIFWRNLRELLRMWRSSSVTFDCDPAGIWIFE